MRPLLSKSEAERLLEPYMGAIRRSYEKAFKLFRMRAGDLAGFLEIRSRASIIRDLALQFLREELAKEPGVRFVEKGNLTVIDVKSKVLLRLKKLHDDFSTSNYPTQQALAFANQESWLPGMNPQTHLEVGYIPDPMWTGFTGLHVVCNRGPMNEWALPIPHSMPTVKSIEPTRESPAKHQGSKVRPRRKQAKAGNDDGDDV